MRKNKNQPLKTQRGFTFLQLSLGLAIAATIATAAIDTKVREDRRTDFKILGNMIAEHSRAVSEWTVDQGGAAIAGTRIGTDWLKSNTVCGITTGGSEAYLPCGFDFNNVKFGADPSTVIQNVGGVTTATTTWPAIEVAGIPESLGVGIAVDQAESNSRDVLDGTILYDENNTGVITASIDINNGTGIYVKRAGDTMTGDLGLTGNNINNVGVMEATTGTFGTVTATGNITATGDLTGDNVYGRQFTDSDDPTTFLNPSGTSRVATLEASSFADREDPSYVMDLNGNSRLNQLEIDGGTVNGYLTLAKIVTEGASCSNRGALASLSTGKAVSCTSGKWEVLNGEVAEPVTHCEAQTLSYYYPKTYTNTTNYNKLSHYSLSKNYSAGVKAIGATTAKSNVTGSALGCGQFEYTATTTRSCQADGTYSSPVLTTSYREGFCSPG